MLAKQQAQIGDGVGPVDGVVELVLVGALGALYRAIEFRGARRQDEELDAELGAEPFEVRLELTAAVDLDRLQPVGGFAQQLVQEISGCSCCGAMVDTQHIPAAHGIPGGKVFEDDPR